MKKQNKNKIFAFGKRLVLDFSAALLLAVMLQPLTHSNLDNAIAEELGDGADGYSVSYPYARTFTISAYYSPLPCQDRYTTGSYEGDIRLNGGGVRGADGTAVYPGMVVAPRTFEFGTKMEIPGVGIVSVHDRGGAIVASGGQPGVYDRLDIWMGYGDKGLTRALNWGKRNVEIIVYGHNDSIVEQIQLADYSADEANPSCNVAASAAPSDEVLVETTEVEEITEVPSVVTPEVVEPAPVEPKVVISAPVATVEANLSQNLKLGSFGAEVENLQKELKQLNFYRGDITGYYGPVTEHAVFKFQQAQSLVGAKSSLGAGIFGPKTRDVMREIAVARRYNTNLVAVATNHYEDEMLARRKGILIASQLGFGMTGSEVSKLQKFLKDEGYFDGALVTEYFGDVTKAAVIKFQIANKLIGSDADPKAGFVGTETLELINTLS